MIMFQEQRITFPISNCENSTFENNVSSLLKMPDTKMDDRGVIMF